MTNTRVCSAENSKFLDLKLRRVVQNPEKILKPYISEGMVVLDMGCGPGFFTIDMTKLVGDSGKVVAADLQMEMLKKLESKVKDTNIENRIDFHEAKKDEIGLSGKFDFILIFYMLHEVPNQKTFLNELKNALKTNGKILISEPKFHVSKKDFQKSIELIEEMGFKITTYPNIFLSRSIIIENKDK